MDELASFVDELYLAEGQDNSIIDEWDAKELIEGCWTAEVPTGITLEAFKDRWNWNVLKAHVFVKDLDGKVFPRYDGMTDRQIAQAIIEAPDWDEVDDLVAYLVDTTWYLDYAEEGPEAEEAWKKDVTHGRPSPTCKTGKYIYIFILFDV